MPGNLLGDTLEGPEFTAVKGVCGIAVLTTQRASGEPHEYRRKTHRTGFPLDGKKNLGDPELINPGTAGFGIVAHGSGLDLYL
jgi:hypothetical protein